MNGIQTEAYARNHEQTEGATSLVPVMHDGRHYSVDLWANSEFALRRQPVATRLISQLFQVIGLDSARLPPAFKNFLGNLEIHLS